MLPALQTRATFQPAYLALYRSGELARRVERAVAKLEDCVLNRAITREEFRGALAAAREAGLLRTDQRSALRVLR